MTEDLRITGPDERWATHEDAVDTGLRHLLNDPLGASRVQLGEPEVDPHAKAGSVGCRLDGSSRKGNRLVDVEAPAFSGRAPDHDGVRTTAGLECDQFGERFFVHLVAEERRRQRDE